MVSWRNVGAEQGHLTLGRLSRARRVHARCAWRARSRRATRSMRSASASAARCSAPRSRSSRTENDASVASVTFLATMLDFSETGQIGLFVDEAMRRGARGRPSARAASCRGQDLAFVFSSLRANDLIWPYVVNNYLLGETPAAFDLLYWNADSTNLPGPMYCYYLRNTYLENKLREPGALTNCGVPVDLGAVEAADLRPRDARGPHRAVALRLPHARAARRRRQDLRARRERPHRRRGQSGVEEPPQPLDSERLSGGARGLAFELPRKTRAAGGRAGRNGSRATAAASARRTVEARQCPSTSRSKPAPGRYVQASRIH